MSANARWQASRLREKYARVFGLTLEEVEIDDEGHYDRYFVFAPKHPELPKWDTGECPQARSRHVAVILTLHGPDQGMRFLSKLWSAFTRWLKSLDNEWDEMMAENARPTRDCKDVQ